MSVDLIHGVVDQHSRIALILHNNHIASKVTYLYKWILAKPQGKVKEKPLIRIIDRGTNYGYTKPV